jgi:hypothetical protein
VQVARRRLAQPGHNSVVDLSDSQRAVFVCKYRDDRVANVTQTPPRREPPSHRRLNTNLRDPESKEPLQDSGRVCKLSNEFHPYLTESGP